MKKKVLLVGPWISGHMQNWLGNNEHPDYEYRILTCHPYKHDCGYTITGRFYINQLISFMLFPFFLLYEVLTFKPNLMHVHFLSSYGLLSCLIPRRKIISLWGTDVNGKASSSKLFNILAIFALKKYNYINSPAVHMTNRICSWGIDKSKVHTFQYGIDIEKLNYLLSKGIKKNENISADEIVVASIRNWDSLYQIEKLIQSWSHLDSNRFRLKVFGKSSDNKIDNDIRQLCSGFDNIEVIGFVSQDVFYKELMSCDSFISIPIMDGTPLSVLESLYLGLSPIVCDIDFYHRDLLLPSFSILSKDFEFNEFETKVITSKTSWRDADVCYFQTKIMDSYSLVSNRKRMFDLYKHAIYS